MSCKRALISKLNDTTASINNKRAPATKKTWNGEILNATGACSVNTVILILLLLCSCYFLLFLRLLFLVDCCICKVGKPAELYYDRFLSARPLISIPPTRSNKFVLLLQLSSRPSKMEF